MTRLSQSDLDATLRFLRQAEAVTGPDPFPSELLDRLRDLVRSDFAAYQECECADSAGGRQVVYEACARGREVDASVPAELEENFWRFKDQNPFCVDIRRRDDLRARKLSDFFTRRQWHRLDLYTEYFRFFGVEDKLMVWLSAPPGHERVVAFDRCGDRDFGEPERFLLNLLQPHLSARAPLARDRRLAAALLLDQNGAALVVLQSPDRIDYTTPAAARLLAHYFGATADSRLPEPVRSWLHRDAARLNGDGLPLPATPPLSVERGNRRLTIRRTGHTLLLDEEVAALTHREREIVEHLAEGHSNAEIAERLTLSPTTVRKHLENIYAKLGVHNRSAAVAATRATAAQPSFDSRDRAVPV